MPKRQLTGIVVSDKMSKTVVVDVQRIKEHKKYKRRFKINKKYKAHDEKGEYRVGDKVVIQECSPISKDKRWKVISLVSREKEEEQKTDENEGEKVEISNETTQKEDAEQKQ